MSATTLPTAYVGSGHLSGTGLWRLIPLLPRDVLLALLHGYRATISHTYGDVCKYYPSCSAYAVGAVQQHGAVKGSALAAARIARCHPWAAGGIDDVPLHRHFRFDLTPHGFVVPPRKD
ncbi:membrane protein insertion efficiency factor YidD [Microbacterium sp. SYP-A9085]|uniref:membrane protein insertion efficiency factor YidD n=1 Tax=Microbacterium sp. SYP-A9085 TaxID=2664454 RepID=UPI00129C0A9C|nr:membrane protein insertion efficiency factor YidD [Microbacterium sp. SYP-A9085]MRH28339.1 membrane protein insertion efficiency factor YidD [Microbacterium sp. SYP-A9085]